MTSPQVMSRALNTHQFRKDVQETGAVREKNANNILGKAQESLFNAKAGLRRFFGGSGDKDKGSTPGSEGSEAGGLSVDGSGAVDTSDLSAAAVGKLRRASMTTYTFNLAAAPTGQVEREVRRLAGLEGPGSGVFGRISAAPEAGGGGAAGCDDVEAMTSGRGGRQGDDEDEDDDDSQYAFQGNRAHSGPSPVPMPSTRSHPHPFLGGAQGSSQRSLLAQARAHSQGALAAVAAAGAADRMHSIDYVDDPAAEPLPDIRPRLGKPGSSSQLLIPSGQGSPGAGPSPLGQGQLGSMRDRKPRNGTNEGFLTASGSASPGPMSPGTPNPGPLGMGLGGSGSASPQGMSHVPRLPTLSSLSVTTPRASGSQHQLSGLGSGPNAVMAMSPSDSRPDSGRPRRAPSHTHGLRPGGEGEGSAHSPGHHSHHGYMGGAGGGGGGGGRWMQQDSDDVASMLAAAGGDADMLQRIMAGGDVGPDGGEAGGLHLPRLGGGGGGGGGADDHAAAERAAERLEQLRKFQDNLDTQLARERQAVATGKVRRSSVLEDAYGHQQPRWQSTYNPEAQSMHGKLSAVDPLRRSEFDNPRLAKFGKELKSGSSGGPGGSGSAASASPVVARARRLSTVMA